MKRSIAGRIELIGGLPLLLEVLRGSLLWWRSTRQIGSLRSEDGRIGESEVDAKMRGDTSSSLYTEAGMNYFMFYSVQPSS